MVGSRHQPLREERVEEQAPVPRALEGVPGALVAQIRTRQREKKLREERVLQQVWQIPNCLSLLFLSDQHVAVEAAS